MIEVNDDLLNRVERAALGATQGRRTVAIFTGANKFKLYCVMGPAGEIARFYSGGVNDAVRDAEFSAIDPEMILSLVERIRDLGG